MQKIARGSWSIVDDNSSSVDAVSEFAYGTSLRKAEELVWDLKVLKIFKVLAKMPVKIARRRAREALRRLGYSRL